MSDDEQTSHEDLDERTRRRIADEPFRAELLTGDRLFELARTIAMGQRVVLRPGRTLPVATLIDRAEKDLVFYSRILARDAREQRPLSSSSEWLLDNFYLIEEQIRHVRTDLPAAFGTELPRLADGPYATFPRLWEPLVALVAHLDARLDRDVLIRYVSAFEDVAPLTMGEVWAVPIVLRAVLVENLRRLAARVAVSQEESRSADEWADRLTTAGQEGPERVSDTLRQLASSQDVHSPVFYIRISQRVRGQEAELEPVVTWLDEHVLAQGLTMEAYVTAENRRQASDQVSIANSITSIRLLTALDWREFFEAVSLVEQTLREDPVGVYERMDFDSRDRYRHALERLAKHSPHSEVEVAEAVVSWALDGLEHDPSDLVSGHVGHYLISDGRYALEKSLDYSPEMLERVHRAALKHRFGMYFGTMAAVTAVTSGLFAWWAQASPSPWLVAPLIMLAALVPVSQLAVDIVNRLSALVWPPRLLPKLDYEQPLAPAHRTLVVVPTLLTSVAGVQRSLDDLEVHYLGNRDEQIHFALLGDLRGADRERVETDAAILRAGENGVRVLNERHGRRGKGPFHLLVRGRTFQEGEGLWMGWERKRGALTDLNRLLRGGASGEYLSREGDQSFLQDVTFVITLDSDTVLPRDGARKLVSAIAHPLNRAYLDTKRRRVVRGYGLVQPRVDMTLGSVIRSSYARMNSGEAGLDPYAGAVSNAYQDVFAEGSFTGKGIYEVDVANAVLEDRIPPNAVLSHDLLEGSFLRTALASDIAVFDETPSSYYSQMERLHRWVRGDWQLLPWLGSRMPDTSGGRVPTTLEPLHRWKMFDNLRRSLVAPTLMLLLVLGFSLLRGHDWSLLALVLGVQFLPAFWFLFERVVTAPTEADLGLLWRSARMDLADDLLRTSLAVATLPHQSWLMLDAAGRALWRQYVSRRGLLEWETAAEAERRCVLTIGDSYRRMGGPIVGGLVLLGVAAVVDPLAVAPVAALAIVWLTGPAFAWQVSRQIPELRPQPDEEETGFLRGIARRTWRFFETFVTAEDHWLAPDNYQEDPKDEVAHRTSPTNIGLQLLTCLTAYDLGYLGVGALVDRVSSTLQTLAGMERFRGHFYNWYDTRTLQPLRPGYISTVDSGNLAGNLIALREGLFEASEMPLVTPQVLDGLADTIRMTIEDLSAEAENRMDYQTTASIRQALDGMLRRVSLEDPPCELGGWLDVMRRLASAAPSVPPPPDDRTGQPHDPALERVRASLVALSSECERHLAEIEMYAPWAHLLAEMPPHLCDSSCALALEPLTRHVPSLVGLAEGLDDAMGELERIAEEPPGTTEEDREAARRWAKDMLDGIEGTRPATVQLLARLRLMADIAQEMWEHTDFRMLYDPSRELFSIGFNTAEGRLDGSYYDLLASECRLASFLAVAKGDVPQEHWFRLGRIVTPAAGGRALVSWSASMFEYLMPLLLMKAWPDTLLDKTYRAAVRRQIQYGRQRGVPWGVSESAFNVKDVELTYQYQAFGVPGLGLKRGLSEDVVIAPYATMLALPIALDESVANLRALAKIGAEGRYGFYESVDFTPGRVPAGSERAVVKAYFAHHQGMALVALGNVLDDERMQRRFHADPVVQSAELLLQERIPRHVPVAKPHVEEVRFIRSVREMPPPVARSYPTPHTPVPATHFLSNGRYSVMVTNAGGGYSRWNNIAVTRYREDITRDCWGSFIYVRELGSPRMWSAAYQPTLIEPDDYHVTFSADKAEYRRQDGDVLTQTEIVVSPEDDVEVRRVSVSNRGDRALSIELTSYLEIALTPQAADQAHKTFSNLFVETEQLEESGALLFTRRPRSKEELRLWGMHVVACDGPICSLTAETDRARFLGRGRSVASPAALDEDAELSGTVGPVLDPVCALRIVVDVPPGDTRRVVFTTGAGTSREEMLHLAETYHEIRSAQRAADLAWTSSQIELRDLGISPDQAVVFQRLASRLLVTDPYSRLKIKTPSENRLPASGLWPLGISGDLPILLVKVDRLDQTPLVRQALLAHQYWRHKGLIADLVVLNTKPSAYSGELAERLKLLVRTGHALQLVDRPGGVFLRNADQMEEPTRNLLESVARAVLQGDSGPLLLQLNQRAARAEPPDPLMPKTEPFIFQPPVFRRPELLFDNGFGGFDTDAHEYVIVLGLDETPKPVDDSAYSVPMTPAPWINVIANPRFGSMVSESGIGCTWAENSHENRITTWNNDAVVDGSGETMYIRDEETGEIWGPTALPLRDANPYVIAHGRGYSRFEHWSNGIAHELTVFVPPGDPVRIARLRVSNTEDIPRRLTVTQAIEWVLGDSRSKANQRVVTWWDEQRELLGAHSHLNPDFPGRPAFLACDLPVSSFTASRMEFLGRNGSPEAPAALFRKGLGGATGRFHDNCGAIMVEFEIEPGGSAEVNFLLGQCETTEEVNDLVDRLRVPGAVEQALDATTASWDAILGAVEARTPDAALDVIVNGPALYQTLACRVWGRTALYQSSGAYGFRDQLQDMLALLPVRPDLVREHILEAARHQFEHGDVMHWWMPKTARGVRTRISDDRHWLAYVTVSYIEATGDTAILDERIPYLIGAELPAGIEDIYIQPSPSGPEATLYEHIVAAFESARAVGEHGLPLIGGGDWNDGMNRVGVEGRGESVWLAWFLDVALRRFAEIAEKRGDTSRAEDYRTWAMSLVEAVERSAWDGAWYRRAYFDDGTPLGSRESAECRIDAIAQAWAVISGNGDEQRAHRALQSVNEHLVSSEDGLIKLLTPPFDVMEHDPGYIKGYVPGVRENGGQYTHAAVWVVLAHLLLGEGDEGHALFDLINPVNHSLRPEDAERYKVEPYVLAADVYASRAHIGRGGWTWYTGSASWFYAVAVRHILGLRVVADGDVRYLVIDPCIPRSWPAFSVTYRPGDGTVYEIEVQNPAGVERGVAQVGLDGAPQLDKRVPLNADGAEHRVLVMMLGG